SADGHASFGPADLDLLSAFAATIAPWLRRALAPPAPPPARDAIAAAGGIAQAVQESIAPRAMPNWPGLQVALYRRPGSVNCCDLYDLLRLGTGTAAFLMARVNARGATLPRLLAETRAAFRTSALH